jgi:hypothetical protein
MIIVLAIILPSRSRGSAVLAAWLLGSRVRTAPGAWMFVSCLYVVLSCVGRGLCDELTTRPKESYQLSKKDSETQKEAASVLHGP